MTTVKSNTGVAQLLRDRPLRGVIANTAIVGTGGALVNTSSSLFLANAVGATPLMIGLFFTGRGLLEIAAGLGLGALSDRLPQRRPLLILCPFLSAAGGLAYAVIREYYVLFAAGAVLFALGGAGFAQIFAYNRDFAESRALNPTLLNAVLRSVTTLCWIIGPPIGFLLIGTSGFSPLYLVAAALYLTSAVLCRWLLPDLSKPVHHERARGNPWAGIPLSLWLLVLAVMVMLTVNNIYQIDIALFITRDLGMDAGFTGLLLGLGAALEVGVILVVGRHADRIGKWRVVLAAVLCAAVFFALLPLAHSKLALILLQVPNAFWTAIVLGIPVTMLQDEMRHRVGVASSLFTSAFQGGILLGGAVTGVVTQWAGFTNVFYVCAALTIFAFLLLLAAWLRTRRAATQQPGPAPVAGAGLSAG
ncbi:sugar efflux transporter [Dactylosporangium sp. CA-139114]|uniref:sugar efflux transporter n=1 Tax=Dactylosporangium sp. CA-139114 TaxID=3239931 RepID=UPI003D988299